MTPNESFLFTILLIATIAGFDAALGLYLIWRSDHK